MIFTVARNSDDFTLDGCKASRLPAIIAPNGEVFLPVVPFIRQRLSASGRAVGSLEDDSYILCGWLNYLRKLKVKWDQPSDRLIEKYAAFQQRKGIKKARVQTCADLIFSFYWAAQFSFGLVADLVQDPAVTSDGTRFPLTARISRKGRPKGSFSFSTIPKGRRRPTPTPEQAEQVLDHLLDHEDIERSHCRWLCGALMRDAGLRVEGVAGMTLKALAAGMKAEGIHQNGEPYDLSDLSADALRQGEIIAEIENLINRHRTNLHFDLIEKSRLRTVRLPLTLLENILHYIWSMRSALVVDGEKSDALFLSLKGGKGLKKKSIGNLVSGAFKALDVPGSAHRLRAAFAENVVRDCYLRQRAVHGAGWDRDSVLLEAAEALGHSTTGSLTYYLNRILRELNVVDGEPILVTAREEIPMLKSLIEAVNSGNQNVIDQLREIDRQLLVAA